MDQPRMQHHRTTQAASSGSWSMAYSPSRCMMRPSRCCCARFKPHSRREPISTMTPWCWSRHLARLAVSISLHFSIHSNIGVLSFVAFVTTMVTDGVKTALFSRLLDILTEHDFIDFITAFFSESVSNFSNYLPSMLCIQMSNRLAQIRENELQ